MIRLSVQIACMTVAGIAATAVARAGIAGDVVRVDHKKQCLWLDWDNNTEKDRLLGREDEVLDPRDGQAGQGRRAAEGILRPHAGRRQRRRVLGD
jgi:hypothetical protein